MSEGKKFDQGKIQPSIVLGDFSRALTGVCKAGETGIVRYGPSNWLKVEDAKKRYEDALLRHWLSSKTEKLDPDSNLLHLAHVAWNALAVLELELREQEQLDFTRPNHETLLADINGLTEMENILKNKSGRSNMSVEDKQKFHKEIREKLEEKIEELEREISKRNVKI